MKRIIITGGTGLIGIELVSQLVLNGYGVTVIVRPNSLHKRLVVEDSRIMWVESELESLCSVADKLHGEYDVFLHMGWETRNEQRRDVIVQSRNIEYACEAVRLAKMLNCKRFIGVGSQEEYGSYDRPLNTLLQEKPDTAYGVAKLAAGKMSEILCKQYGIEHIWVRIVSVYSKYDNFVSKVIQAMLRGERFSLTKCEQIWDFLYVEDAARALILLIENGKEKTYILGSGVGKRLSEYMMTIQNIVYREKNKYGVLGIGDLEYGSNQVMYLVADISELKNDVGFAPNVSFEDGVKLIVNHFCPI